MTSDQDPAAAGPSEDDFPYMRRCPFSVPAEYETLRDQPGPELVGLRPGGKTWLVTRYEQVRAALHHPALSNNRRSPGYPSPIPIPDEFRTGGSLLGMDAPEHTALRRALTPEFTARRAQELRPWIAEVVDAALDDMIAGPRPADLHAALGTRITMTVITGLLGITLADQRFLHDRTRVMFESAHTPEARRAAITELDDHFVEIVREKRARPTEDMLSRIIVRVGDGADDRALAQLTRLLLNGGHDSTASMISLGVLTLLNHPDQADVLRADPTLGPAAVEELLRFLTVADLTTPRAAVADLDLAGVAVSAGEGVFPSAAAANRDPAVFDRPDELDLRRGTRKHLAFGFGRHLCLGAEFARLELELAYTGVLRRLPTLRLAVPMEDLQFRQRGLVFGVTSLPVTW